MAFNKSVLALDYLRDLWERAHATVGGIKITCRTHGEAMALRSRLHYYRAEDRDANKAIYPSDHPLHKASVWDALECKVIPPKTGAVLHVKPRAVDHLIIEPLLPQDD